MEKSVTKEQEIVLFIESKDAAVPRSLLSSQYRSRALQLLCPLKHQEVPLRETQQSG